MGTRVFGGAKRYLPPDSKERNGNTRLPPARRTQEETIRRGRKLRRLKSRATKTACDQYIKKTGVLGISPLTRLPYFDIVDQCFLDLMHMVKNSVHLHFLKRMSGRCPVPAVPRNKMKPKSAADLGSMTQRAREIWEKKFAARSVTIETLKVQRDEIIEDDGYWVIPEVRFHLVYYPVLIRYSIGEARNRTIAHRHELIAWFARQHFTVRVNHSSYMQVVHFVVVGIHSYMYR